MTLDAGNVLHMSGWSVRDCRKIENAVLPPGKTAFLYLPYRDPHSRNSGKLLIGSAHGKIMIHLSKKYISFVLIFSSDIQTIPCREIHLHHCGSFHQAMLHGIAGELHIR